MPKRRLPLLLILILGVPALALGTVYFYRKPLLAGVISRKLSQLVGTEIQVEFQSLGWSAARVRVVSPKLSLELNHLVGKWGITSLRDGAFHFEIMSPESEAASSRPSFRFNYIRLSKTDWGVSVQAHAPQVGQGKQQFNEVRLNASVTPTRFQVTAQGQSASFQEASISFDAPGLPDLSAGNEILFSGNMRAKLPWILSEGPVNLRVTKGGEFKSLRTELSHRVESVDWPAETLREFQTLLDVNRPTSSWHASVSLKLLGRALGSAEADFDRDFAFFRAKANLSWDLSWSEGKNISPNFKNWLTDGSGKVSFRGTADGKLDRFKSEGVLDFDRVTAHPLGVPLKALNAKLHFTSVWPAIVRKLRVTVSSLGARLPLTDLSFELESKGPKQILIEGLSGNWARGKISAESIPIDFEPRAGKAFFRLDKISLEDVFSAAQDNRLRAQGTVSGHIPVSFKDGELKIDQAELKSDDKGWLHYQGLGGKAAEGKIVDMKRFEELMAQGEQALVFKALDNFHYDLLIFRVNRTRSADLTAFTELKGRNPDLAKGMPFEFNINLSGQVEAALRETVMRLFVNPESLWQNSKKHH